MKLSEEKIEEFRKICEANGISLTMDEAHEEARNLLTLAALLARPLPSEIAEHERAVRAEQGATFLSSSNQNEPPETLPLL